MAGFITVRGAREHNLKNIDVAMVCWFPSAASPTVMVKCIPDVRSWEDLFVGKGQHSLRFPPMRACV